MIAGGNRLRSGRPVQLVVAAVGRRIRVDRGAEVTLRQAAEAELSRLQASAGSNSRVLLDVGEPARIICSAAERMAADLLIIGRGSASGSFGRLRTNAYAIIRQSPCPVVSV